MIEFLHHNPHAVVQGINITFENRKWIGIVWIIIFAVRCHWNEEVIRFFDVFPHPFEGKGIQAGAVVKAITEFDKSSLTVSFDFFEIYT